MWEKVILSSKLCFSIVLWIRIRGAFWIRIQIGPKSWIRIQIQYIWHFNTVSQYENRQAKKMQVFYFFSSRLFLKKMLYCTCRTLNFAIFISCTVFCFGWSRFLRCFGLSCSWLKEELARYYLRKPLILSFHLINFFFLGAPSFITDNC